MTKTELIIWSIYAVAIIMIDVSLLRMVIPEMIEDFRKWRIRKKR